MDHTPSQVDICPRDCLRGQLAFYGINDPLWLPMLLRHLAAGGCVLIERCGDLVIMPGLDSGSTLSQ